MKIKKYLCKVTVRLSIIHSHFQCLFFFLFMEIVKSGERAREKEKKRYPPKLHWTTRSSTHPYSTDAAMPQTLQKCLLHTRIIPPPPHFHLFVYLFVSEVSPHTISTEIPESSPLFGHKTSAMLQVNHIQTTNWLIKISTRVLDSGRRLRGDGWRRVHYLKEKTEKEKNRKKKCFTFLDLVIYSLS